jgi:signal transduction histidine kinase
MNNDEPIQVESSNTEDEHPHHFVRHRQIATKLLTMIILMSSLITLITTVLILLSDFYSESDAMDDSLNRAVSASLGGLGHSVWHYDDATTKIQLEGLLNVQGVMYAKIVTNQGFSYESGKQTSGQFVYEEQQPLIYRDQEIAQLKMIVSKKYIFNKVISKALSILLSQAAKTFIVSIIILWLVHHIVTRHIIHISEYASSMTAKELDKALILENKKSDNDEIDRLVEALNQMRGAMQRDFQARASAEQALMKLSSDLDLKVRERTRELESANRDLSDLIRELKTAQQRIVLAEKSAALGQLVFGVAHELNTPLGNAIMASSGISQELNKEAEFQNTEIIIEFAKITEKSLKRAADIIQAFRQISANREELDEYFNLHETVTDMETSLMMQLHPDTRLTIDIPEHLQVTTKKKAMLKCIEGLVLNAQYHGYGMDIAGSIKISAQIKDEELHVNVQDEGTGIKEENKYRIFDPFFTTDRVSGKIGIGLSVIHNLVTTLMMGHIECYSIEGKGSEFSIRIPNHPERTLGSTPQEDKRVISHQASP